MATVYAIKTALSKVEQGEMVRRIGLAGQALVQLRQDYQQQPSSLGSDQAQGAGLGLPGREPGQRDRLGLSRT